MYISGYSAVVFGSLIIFVATAPQTDRTPAEILECHGALPSTGYPPGSNATAIKSLLDFCIQGCQCVAQSINSPAEPICSESVNGAISGFRNSTAGQLCTSNCVCELPSTKTAGAQISGRPAGYGAGTNLLIEPSQTNDPPLRPSPIVGLPLINNSSQAPSISVETPSSSLLNTSGGGIQPPISCPTPGPVVDPNLSTGVINLYCQPPDADVWLRILPNFDAFSAITCEPCPGGVGPDPNCVKQPHPLPGPCCRQNGACWHAGDGTRFGTANAVRTISNNSGPAEPTKNIGPQVLPTSIDSFDCESQARSNSTQIVKSFLEFQCALALAQGAVFD